MKKSILLLFFLIVVFLLFFENNIDAINYYKGSVIIKVNPEINPGVMLTIKSATGISYSKATNFKDNFDYYYINATTTRLPASGTKDATIFVKADGFIMAEGPNGFTVSIPITKWDEKNLISYPGSFATDLTNPIKDIVLVPNKANLLFYHTPLSGFDIKLDITGLKDSNGRTNRAPTGITDTIISSSADFPINGDGSLGEYVPSDKQIIITSPYGDLYDILPISTNKLFDVSKPFAKGIVLEGGKTYYCDKSGCLYDSAKNETLIISAKSGQEREFFIRSAHYDSNDNVVTNCNIQPCLGGAKVYVNGILASTKSITTELTTPTPTKLKSGNAGIIATINQGDGDKLIGQGTYLITCKLDGYLDYNEKIIVGSTPLVKEIICKMRPKKIIEVASSQEYSKILLDNIEQSITTSNILNPITYVQIYTNVGQHTIELKKSINGVEKSLSKNVTFSDTEYDPKKLYFDFSNLCNPGEKKQNTCLKCNEERTRYDIKDDSLCQLGQYCNNDGTCTKQINPISIDLLSVEESPADDKTLIIMWNYDILKIDFTGSIIRNINYNNGFLVKDLITGNSIKEFFTKIPEFFRKLFRLKTIGEKIDYSNIQNYNFTIYRKDGESDYKLITSVLASSDNCNINIKECTYSDINLDKGATYYYKIKGDLLSGGRSIFSTSDGVTSVWSNEKFKSLKLCSSNTCNLNDNTKICNEEGTAYVVCPANAPICDNTANQCINNDQECVPNQCVDKDTQCNNNLLKNCNGDLVCQDNSCIAINNLNNLDRDSLGQFIGDWVNNKISINKLKLVSSKWITERSAL